jgi:hypothetical protein
VANLLWIVVVVFLVLWVLGFTALHLGTILRLFLVLAIIFAIISIFTGGYFRT